MKPYDYRSRENLDHFIREALREDIGTGDYSTLAAIPASAESRARCLVKEDCVLAGVALARAIFEHLDPSLSLSFLKREGEFTPSGSIAFTVSGSARGILSAERLVLNCMQRMSGVATDTRKLVGYLKGTKAQLLDTRKTTPNFRLPEKWAVAIGGGQNHRYGLFDGIMLKDNHIDFSGGIEKAIQNTLHYLRETGKVLPIEIETRKLEEVEQVLRVGGIQRIMLDNMSLADMREAVALIGGRYETEASGGITEKELRHVAETGVDYISMGALTQAVQSRDISLKAF